MQVFVVCLLPLAIYAVPCTDPPTEAPPSTTTTSTLPPTTTEYIPPPSQFPKGTYALIRPDSGCPAGKFKVFSRYWDTEDYSNANRYPAEEHFMGDLKKDGLELSMCVKTTASSGEGNWPAGEYCILKKNKCPKGFSSGSITWDDENTFNKNSVTGNKRNAPDGKFNADTRLDFCCRTDGNAYQAIKLPIDKPFYLLRNMNECQRVWGMDVTEEVVYWDNEDEYNGDTSTGDIPLEDGGSTDNRLHFCYYQAQAGQ